MLCNYGFLFSCLLLPLIGHAHESPICAATIGDLRNLIGDQAFPLQWEETSMDDGKPLRVSILERKGALLLEFTKTKEGLWAESGGFICRAGADFKIRFSAEQIRLGPAANWVLRGLLGNGGTFTLTKLGSEQLRIAASGWSGTFSAAAKKSLQLPSDP